MHADKWQFWDCDSRGSPKCATCQSGKSNCTHMHVNYIRSIACQESALLEVALFFFITIIDPNTK